MTIEIMEHSVKEEKKAAKELGKLLFETIVRPHLFMVEVADSICEEINKYEATK